MSKCKHGLESEQCWLCTGHRQTRRMNATISRGVDAAWDLVRELENMSTLFYSGLVGRNFREIVFNSRKIR